MAASPTAAEGGSKQPQDKWGPGGDQGLDPMGPAGDAEPNNSAQLSERESRVGQDTENPAFRRESSVGDASLSGSKGDTVYREKQVKPNKVYVGGLPEHTREEDLQSCFGKIGKIVNIELKVGYGFVEFDSREAAEESVAKYHEGYFMGNKIRVEISRGGGRTSKVHGDPGACFKCGLMGHWARECPNHVVQSGGSGAHRRLHHSDAPLIDRIQPSRDYPLPPPPRDFPPYRDEFGPPGRYPPPRDSRYGYDYPPLPPPGRDLRRPSSPRDYRDYAAGPPPPRSARDYDDYRMRGPPLPPPPPRYERPGYYPVESDGPPPGYPPRGYGPPRDPYDRHERRPPPPSDRYLSYPPPPAARPRTPPGGPPRNRDDFERPPREYPPPLPEFRGRPASPPSRYADYPRSASAPGSPPRYRRRSQSPPLRSSGGAPYEPAYSGAPREGFTGNGYSGSISGGPPSSGPPPRSGGSSRDYSTRNGRDTRDAGEPSGSYRRA